MALRADGKEGESIPNFIPSFFPQGERLNTCGPERFEDRDR